MITKKKRLQTLTDILKIKNAGTIRELSQALNVSEMTVRRDLTILAKENTIKLIHGGAIYNHTSKINQKRDNSIYNLPNEEATRTNEKRRIAEKAVSLIQQDDIIIIDSGSTTELMGDFIQSSNPSTIVCYAMNILFSVFRQKECKLIFGGGYLHKNTLMFESKEGVELIKNNRANKAFISARGVSDILGITTADSYEIPIKRAAVESSQQRILLVDSSKFDVVRSAYFGDIKDFDKVITDDKIPKRYIELFKQLEIELIIV
jgi:DeoR family transcriptional regulator, deoxyribose operon repressor